MLLNVLSVKFNLHLTPKKEGKREIEGMKGNEGRKRQRTGTEKREEKQRKGKIEESGDMKRKESKGREERFLRYDRLSMVVQPQKIGFRCFV